jgi:hypothetical protein
MYNDDRLTEDERPYLPSIRPRAAGQAGEELTAGQVADRISD